MRKDTIKAKKVLAQHYDVDNKMDEYAITQAMKSYAHSQTQELQEQNAELVSALKNILDFKKYQREEDFISIEELDELLNKYNHLKSNTND